MAYVEWAPTAIQGGVMDEHVPTRATLTAVASRQNKGSRHHRILAKIRLETRKSVAESLDFNMSMPD